MKYNIEGRILRNYVEKVTSLQYSNCVMQILNTQGMSKFDRGLKTWYFELSKILSQKY